MDEDGKGSSRRIVAAPHFNVVMRKKKRAPVKAAPAVTAVEDHHHAQPGSSPCTSRIHLSHVPETVPNLFWTAVDTETLSQWPDYVALPQVVDGGMPGWCVGPASLRFIPQGTDLWRAAHAGVLTTGIVADTLGFKEERVARRMGCASYAGHSHMLAAVQHLRLPLHPTMQPAAHDQDTPGVDTNLGSQHQVHISLPGQLELLQALERANACAEESHGVQGQQRDSSPQGVDGPLTAHYPGQHVPRAPAPVPLSWSQGRTSQELLLTCIKAAREGLSCVSQQWGNVQEAASLYGLASFMPRAVLHQAGMFVLQPHQLPQHWGFTPGNLPPLAASPDALICHPLVCHAATHQHAPPNTPSHDGQQCTLARLHAGLASYANGSCRAASHDCSSNAGPCTCGAMSMPGSVAVDNGGWADPACLRQLRQSCQRQLDQLIRQQVLVLGGEAKAQPEGQEAGSGADDSDGADSGGESGEEDSVGLGLEALTVGDDVVMQSEQAVGVDVGQGSQGSGCSMPEGSREQYAGLRQAVQSGRMSLQLLSGGTPIVLLPPSTIASQDDSMGDQQQPQGCHHQQQTPPPLQQQPQQQQQQQYQQQYQQQHGQQQQQALQCDGCGVMVEVVEIKNTVPFKLRARKRGARGRTVVEWCVSDRGPRERMPPHWVPQLQLHMLTTGCQSALLVSRSVVRGMRVWRIWRDDEYLCRMLRAVSRVYSSFVLSGKAPPANALHSDAGYQSLLHNSARIARTATCIGYWPGPAPLYPGSDSRPLI